MVGLTPTQTDTLQLLRIYLAFSSTPPVSSGGGVRYAGSRQTPVVTGRRKEEAGESDMSIGSLQGCRG